MRVPHIRAAVLGLALTLLLAACGAAAPSSAATSGTDTTPGVTAAPGESASPLETATPGGSEAPTATETPAPTDSPVATDEPTPTEVPSGPVETVVPDPTPGTADACSGSDKNREFFDVVARSVKWPVLCGVLPKGWFVKTGHYWTAGGGRMYVEYDGPGTSRLGLYEGGYCATEGGCDVSGPDASALGGAPLGPLAGTLYQTADGYAIVVASGENPSWFMTTIGLDQATTLALAAKVAEVGG